MSEINLEKFFKNKDLYTQALTHRSWLNEHHLNFGHNERLEFLGDAVLEFLVSDYLYHRFPDKEEGVLTALRANMVNTVNLSKVANELKIGKLVLMSKGEEEGGGRNNNSILADTFEALVGAMNLDQGEKQVISFLEETPYQGLSEILTKPLKDAKSRLQELVQGRGFAAPKYHVAREEGPDHDKIFVIEVLVDQKRIAFGDGKSKSEAEQIAAEKAIEIMNH